MTDEQFSELITTLAMNQKDHDLLIEIKTLVNANKEQSERCRASFNQEIGCVKTSIGKAHNRVDKAYFHLGIPQLVIFLIGVVSLILMGIHGASAGGQNV